MTVRGMGAGFGRAFGGAGFEVGDPGFDRAVLVRGWDEEATVAALSAAARRRIVTGLELMGGPRGA